jgi:hypothetical protein
MGGCHPCIHDVVAPEKSDFTPYHPLKVLKNGRSQVMSRASAQSKTALTGKSRRKRPVPYAMAGLGSDSSFYVTRFRAWMPALSFLGFWTVSFLMYLWGPLVNPKLNIGTWVYLIASLGLFALAYHIGLGRLEYGLKPAVPAPSSQNRFSARWVNTLVVIGFIGIAGLALDRMLFAGASIEKTLTDTESVRAETAMGNTLLTTISMIPYCFSAIAMVLYFYGLALKWRLAIYTHLLLFGMLGLMCFNAFLGANRGQFYCVLIYVLQLMFFVKGDRPLAVAFSKAYRGIRLLLLLFVVLSVSYFVFIAKHRNEQSYLNYLYKDYSERDRYGLVSRANDPDSISGMFHVMEYGTGTLPTVDQFVLRAPPFAFDPIPLLGGRTLDQVRKIIPDYESKSGLLGRQWRMESGIDLSSWPSMFGWNLAQCGYVGAVLFMGALGWFFARTARHYLIYFDAGSAILNFAIFCMLSTTFNSFGGDIPHTVAFAAGLYLFVSSPKLVRARRARGLKKPR